MSGISFHNYESQQHPFLRANRFIEGEFDEPTGSEYTLEQGQLMARDASTGKLVVHDSTNTAPGAKIPVGVVGQTKTIAANATGVNVPLCVSGDVLQSAIKLGGSDDLETQVTIQDGSAADTGYSRRIKDLIEGETLGIHLVTADELSKFDNQ